MQVQMVETDLLNACTTLFGSEINASIDFLNYLQASGLKTAYRKRAMETHPDRCLTLGRQAGLMNEQFKRVKEAYETLLTFIEQSNRRIIRTTVKTRQQPTPSKKKKPAPPKKQPPHRNNPTDHYYTGRLPNRELLIGQYLYYSGAISWRTLIRAIAWQIKHRPRIGQLAVDWGIMTRRDIVKILSQKSWNEKFGECALRTGHITKFEHIALLGKQRGIQSPLCRYFIRKQILSQAQISYYLRKQALHNLNLSRKKK